MAATDPRVDAYIRTSPAFAQPILRHIRKAVHAAAPGVRETMKWSTPHFDYKGIFCGMSAFKAHVGFGFWKAALLKDLLPGTGLSAAGQFGRITSIGDLPGEKKLARIIKTAAQLNDEGVKAPPMRKGPRPALAAPSDLLKAINKNKKAKATFDAFPPGQRREYIAWILEAKQPATRERRIESAVGWMAEGKVRNWKYVK
jgi:uncharacterized protein YdeI (YjbR/CyaY-like superfamily)